MDAFIYALVMVPALKDLLPASGIRATPENTGYYGGLLFAIFLVGWGFAFLWGPIADKFGRVKTLMFTIVCYSVFTFLGCIAHSVWQLAAFRFLRGHGHWRRMDAGRNAGSGRVAGEPASARRRLHAHRVLFRHVPGSGGELLGGRALWMARDVCGGRDAGAAGRVYPRGNS